MTFAALFRAHEDALTRAWVDEIYADRRTDLPSLLSYRQLVEHLPEMLDELARLLDERASEAEITERVRTFRTHAQVRFQERCLLDEVARELMLLREVLHEFLWREGIGAAGVDVWELRDVLARTNLFVDELVAQTVVVYAASLRPPVRTRASLWPPPGRRRPDFPPRDKAR